MHRGFGRIFVAVAMALTACSTAGAVPAGQSAPLSDVSGLNITSPGSNVGRTAGARAADEINGLDFSTLVAAAAQASATGKPLRIPAGSYSYTGGTTLTISAPVIFEPGAVLSCSGSNVAFAGLLTAPRTKIFAAGCTPTLGNIADAVYPEWWGASCAGGDDTVALQAAITAAGASSPRKVMMTGVCHASSALQVVNSGVEFACHNWQDNLFLNTATANVDLFYVNGVSNFFLHDCALGSSQAQGTGSIVHTVNSGSLTFNHLFVWGNNLAGNGFTLTNANGVFAHNVWVQNTVGACWILGGATSSTTGAVGFLDSLGAITGGSGGTAGTYYSVTLTGGNGFGALANITVSGGAVTAITLLQQTGNSYHVGDVLSAASANIGGVTGFSVPVATTGTGTVDFTLDSHSRCDGTTGGVQIGIYTGGIYITDNIFYANTGSAIAQTATQIQQIGGSYQIVGNDFDTSPILNSSADAMYFFNAFDVMITGNRIAYVAGNAINALNANQLVISGNKLVGIKGSYCITLGTPSGSAFPTQDWSITGNVINGCLVGVNLNNAAVNGVIASNTFSKIVNYTISTNCNDSVSIGANNSRSSGPAHWGCGGLTSTYYAGVDGPRLLGKAIGASFNTTSDQPIQLASNITKFDISKIEVTNCSATPNAAIGGFYSGASKTGTAIVAATQAYSGATASTVILTPVLAAAGGSTAFTSSQIYFSLSTPQGSVVTCDIYLFGDDLS